MIFRQIPVAVARFNAWDPAVANGDEVAESDTGSVSGGDRRLRSVT